MLNKQFHLTPDQKEGEPNHTSSKTLQVSQCSEKKDQNKKRERQKRDENK